MIPVLSRGSPSSICVYLLTQGYTGNINDVIYKYLGDEGHFGSLPDRWKSYLEAEGFSGSVADMRIKWIKDVTPSNWILASGVWNDGGNWQDGETWSDS